jgi:hypothetical protein
VKTSAVRPDAQFGKAARKAGLLAATAVSFALAAASLAHAQAASPLA